MSHFVASSRNNACPSGLEISTVIERLLRLQLEK
jgi:hypothetical protein